MKAHSCPPGLLRRTTKVCKARWMSSRRTFLTTALCAAAGSTLGGAFAGSPAAAWPGPYVTVAADGSGDFTGVQAAVDAVPSGNTGPFTIKVRPGIYRGQVIIPADK